MVAQNVPSTQMHKRRAPPSAQRVEKANRVLAEMVLRGPRTVHTDEVAGQANGLSDGALTEAKTAPIAKEEEEARTVSTVEKKSITKPVAMSIVDFSYVLSLVFGGCCSYVLVTPCLT